MFVRTSRRMVFTAVLCLILAAGRAHAKGHERRDCAGTAGRFLPERLAVWQQRLKLDDWKISVVMAHSRDLKPNTLGSVRWYDDEKVALIKVLDTSDYHVGCRETLKDMEFTIVHELLHLKLASLPRSEASRSEEEFAVNHIANALLLLDRRK